MKTLKIVKMMMLSILLGTSTQKAFAADTITCQASNNEIFSFSFGALPNPNSGMANDLHPKGVAIKSSPIEIHAKLASTRFGIVGTQYNFTLPNGTDVLLTNITTGFESELGMSGIARLTNGTYLDLSCE